jgi:hypothetical protein
MDEVRDDVLRRLRPQRGRDARVRPADPGLGSVGQDGQASRSSCRGQRRSSQQATRLWPTPRLRASPASSAPRNRRATTDLVYPFDGARRRGPPEDVQGEEPPRVAATSVSGRACSPGRRFQFSRISPMVIPDEFVPSPTAATVPSLRAVIPVRVRKSGTGLVTMLQLVPFQFWMAG